MRSRLDFGLSMAFDFDDYLIDEVMSVGDAHFKRKCADVFEERLQKSKVVLVSHSKGTTEIRHLLARPDAAELFRHVRE